MALAGGRVIEFKDKKVPLSRQNERPQQPVFLLPGGLAMNSRRRSILVSSVVAVLMGIPALHAEWVHDGVAICNAPDYQHSLDITYDGAGGAVMVWRDDRNGRQRELYAQKVDAQLEGRVDDPVRRA